MSRFATNDDPAIATQSLGICRNLSCADSSGAGCSANPLKGWGKARTLEILEHAIASSHTGIIINVSPSESRLSFELRQHAMLHPPQALYTVGNIGTSGQAAQDTIVANSRLVSLLNTHLVSLNQLLNPDLIFTADLAPNRNHQTPKSAMRRSRRSAILLGLSSIFTEDRPAIWRSSRMSLLIS